MKTRLLLLIAAIIASIGAVVAQSVDIEHNGHELNYKINSDGKTATCTGFADLQTANIYGTVEIPSTFRADTKTFTVTDIADQAFARNNSTLGDHEIIGRVVLPYTVTDIGESAFAGAIRERWDQGVGLDLSQSETLYIGKYAFQGCQFSSVTFGDNLDIRNAVKWQFSGLRTEVIYLKGMVRLDLMVENEWFGSGSSKVRALTDGFKVAVMSSYANEYSYLYEAEYVNALNSMFGEDGYAVNPFYVMYEKANGTFAYLSNYDGKNFLGTYEEDMVFPSQNKSGYTQTGWKVLAPEGADFQPFDFEIGTGLSEIHLSVLDIIDKGTEAFYEFFPYAYLTPSEEVYYPQAGGEAKFMVRGAVLEMEPVFSKVGTFDVEITYSANVADPAGLSGSMSAQTVTSGKTINLSPNAYKLSGFRFVGWEYTYGGNTTEYYDGQEVTFTRDADLKAKWERASEYSLIFNANGGEGTMSAQRELGYTEFNIAKNAFTRSDMYFLGWSTSATGDVEYADEEAITLTDNETLYAVWSSENPEALTITFDANGGEGTMPVQKIDAGVNTTLNSNAYTREGYTFVGWSETANGNADYVDEGRINTDIDITLYAVWEEEVVEPDMVNIYFYRNGGEGVMDKQTAEKGESVMLNPSLFTKDHDWFLGWATDRDSQTVDYEDGETITVNDNLSLFAVWATAISIEDVEDNKLRIEGRNIISPTVQTITIVDVNGRVIYNGKTDRYYLSAPAGVYIIMVDGKRIKVFFN